MFRDHIGLAFPVAELDQEHIKRFLGVVCRLPGDAGTRYQQKGETLADLLAAEAEEGISESTFRDNYRATLAKFLRESYRDAKKRGFPDLSADYPYTGERRGVQDKQRHLKESELIRLFNGLEFQGIAAEPRAPVVGCDSCCDLHDLIRINPRAHLVKQTVIGLDVACHLGRVSTP